MVPQLMGGLEEPVGFVPLVKFGLKEPGAGAVGGEPGCPCFFL